jgi:hypothetical protein
MANSEAGRRSPFGCHVAVGDVATGIFTKKIIGGGGTNLPIGRSVVWCGDNDGEDIPNVVTVRRSSTSGGDR